MIAARSQILLPAKMRELKRLTCIQKVSIKSHSFFSLQALKDLHMRQTLQTGMREGSSLCLGWSTEIL